MKRIKKETRYVQKVFEAATSIGLNHNTSGLLVLLALGDGGGSMPLRAIMQMLEHGDAVYTRQTVRNALSMLKNKNFVAPSGAQGVHNQVWEISDEGHDACATVREILK